MNECSIRKATLADYGDVMAIGDIYDGLDFLPDLYEDFIQDPDCHCFICLVDGEIIGFLAAALIDGSTAFVLRGGRVKETHQGRGYYKALREHIYTLMAKVDSVKHEKVVVDNQIAETLMHPNSGFDLLSVQKLHDFNIPEGVGLNVTSELQPLTPNDLETILSCPRAQTSLFPDDLVFVHRIPFSADAGNLKNLFDKRTVIYGTKSAGDDYKLISTGRHFHTRLGFRYWVEFLGTMADDFREHILAHLAHMRTLSTKNVSLGFAVNLLFPEDCLEEISEIGGVRGSVVPTKDYTFTRKL